jgi:hypothetical protein
MRLKNRISVISAIISLVLFKVTVYYSQTNTRIEQALTKIHTENLLKFVSLRTENSFIQNILIRIPELISNIENFDSIIQSNATYIQWQIETNPTTYGTDLAKEILERLHLHIDSGLLLAIPQLSGNMSTDDINLNISKFIFRIISSSGTLYIIKLAWIGYSNTNKLLIEPQVYRIHIKNYVTLIDLGISYKSLSNFILSGDIEDKSSIVSSLNETELQNLNVYADTNPCDKMFWSAVMNELLKRYDAYSKYSGVSVSIFKNYAKTIRENYNLIISILSKKYMLNMDTNVGELIEQNFKKLLYREHRKNITNLRAVRSKLIQVNDENDQEWIESLYTLERLSEDDLHTLYQIYKIKSDLKEKIIKGTILDNEIILAPDEESIIRYWNMISRDIKKNVFNNWSTIRVYLKELDDIIAKVTEGSELVNLEKPKQIYDKIYEYYFYEGPREGIKKLAVTFIILMVIVGLCYSLYYLYYRQQVVQNALLEHVTRVTESLTGVSYIINALGPQNIFAFLIIAFILLIIILGLLIRLFRRRGPTQTT